MKRAQAGIALCLLMLYLLSVCNQWCMCFFINCRIANYICYEEDIQLFAKVTRKVRIVILPKKSSNSGFLGGIQ